MPSVLHGRALFVNYLAIGVALLVAAVSAFFHLRDDVRHERPLRM